MAHQRHWAGLDLGMDKVDVCIVDEAGQPLLEQSCAASLEKVEAILRQFPGIELVGVEAGPESHFARSLRERGYPVAIFEARKARNFLKIRRNKTDASDARGIADIARIGRGTVSQVHLKSLECQRLRSLLSMRHRAVQLRKAAVSTVRFTLALYGLRPPTTRSASTLRARVEQAASRLLEQGVDLRDEIMCLVELAGKLWQLEKQIEASLSATARAHPVCRRFLGIPGIGTICAISFYSAVEEPGRFHRNCDVGAYLGLTPRRYQSGGISYTTRISRMGNSLTRFHLFAAALTFRQYAPPCALKDWTEKMRARIGPARAKVALARKLAVLMLAMWKSGSDFEPYPQREDGRLCSL